MTETQILDGIRQVASEHLDHDGELRADTPLREAMELDSIRLLTLVVELENHFDIDLEEGDEDDIKTVGELVGLLRSRLA